MVKNRGLKTRTAFSNSIENGLYKQLIELNKETNIPISKLLDKAVGLLLESYNKSTE